ncbi:unnamed protein product [Allacma fusca]|uniref:Nuclear inhibitor of protein phosphatase 1 n=1 Tax=Allacma fusca TaxID=39272 RepID=A0A8J2PVG0_9HEXA|nr:unnamed protein product [Allacma fusca]
MNPEDIPKWAAKPPPGLHLDVMKGDKLIQKLMIDEKKCYLFGRNPQLNDFCIDHASCSRIHAALVYHKHLDRSFLIDLGSTHGTYIGRLRLDSKKPTQLPLDSMFHFGASTRQYVMRARPPTVVPRPIMEELEKSSLDSEGALLGLPETDSELDNLTEFNTAHNRRISMLGIVDDNQRLKSTKRKRKGVSFNEEEEIINPEDIDPTVGRFRNLVQTTVIPSSKRPKLDSGLVPNPSTKHFVPRVSLYDDLPDDDVYKNSSVTTPFFNSLSTKLGLPLPNPAPEVEIIVEEPLPPVQPVIPPVQVMDLTDEPRKKKYAKEAWPGKKHGPQNLLV